MDTCDATDQIGNGDPLQVDIAGGVIRNRTRSGLHRVAPLPPFIQAILDAGGIVKHLAATGGR